MSEFQRPPSTWRAACYEWAVASRQKLSAGTFQSTDLQELEDLLAAPIQTRQRVLYLYADSPDPRAGLMAMRLVEPVVGGAEISLSPEPRFPYRNVHEALLDGWQIVKFPEHQAPVNDREIEVPGAEFILQKLEEYIA